MKKFSSFKGFNPFSNSPLFDSAFAQNMDIPPAQHMAIPPYLHFDAVPSVQTFVNCFGQIQNEFPAEPIAMLAIPVPSVASSAVRSVAPSIKKRERKMCHHGRQEHICKDCKGKNICEHGVQRNQCKKCGGKGICVHNRIRWQCAQCGGASMCVHGRRKARCVDCGGTAICIHQKVKYKCKECKISSTEKQAAAILAEGNETPRIFALVRAAFSGCVKQTNQ